MRRAITTGLTSLCLLGAVACSDETDGDSTQVTSTDTATTQDSSTVSVTPTSAPAASDSAPGTSGTNPTATPPITAAPTATTLPPPPTAAPVVGNPVVASEVIASVDSPVDLGIRPGDDRLYLLEQAGRVVRVGASGGEPEVIADLTDRVGAGGERGLLGIAFSADATRVWLNYSAENGDNVIAEYPVDGDGGIDVDAERVLLRFGDPYPNHNGGDLLVGTDGMLYIAVGDGGSGGDPERRASDPASLFGKILRIDPNPTADAEYGVPPDNPFGNEVWALGLRNPWKFTIDEATGELWVADVGQNAFEEINVVPADGAVTAGRGANFGWSAYEANGRYNDDVADPGDLIFPVFVYDHSQGCSISGGEVYRGTAIAELAPAYVYSDYCSGTLWALDAAGGRTLTLGQFDGVTAVRTGPDRELYVLEAGGDVHRLIQG